MTTHGHIIPLRRGLIQKNMPASVAVRKPRSEQDTKAGYVKWYYFHEPHLTFRQIGERVGEDYNFVRNIIDLNYHAKAPMLRPPKRDTGENPMSYSISAKGDTKAEARANAEAKFASDVLANQPVHEHDKAAAFANVDAHLALTDEPKEGEEVHISMHGSVSWTNIKPDSGPDIQRFTHAGSGCSISVITKPTA